MEQELIEMLKRMESKIDKNAITLENLTKKVETIAETQTSHGEQNERQFNKVINIMNEKTNLLEGALTNVSKDTSEIKESIEVLKEMTGKHEVEINILKRRPV